MNRTRLIHEFSWSFESPLQYRKVIYILYVIPTKTFRKVSFKNDQTSGLRVTSCTSNSGQRIQLETSFSKNLSCLNNEIVFVWYLKLNLPRRNNKQFISLISFAKNNSSCSVLKHEHFQWYKLNFLRRQIRECGNFS